MLQDEASIEDIARRIQAETGGFTGGPVETFAQVGRDAMAKLELCGMRPDSNVLDIGCGVLRLGYWLIRYLDSGRYFGLEPNRTYVDIGLKIAIGPELAEKKKPRFRPNDRFDFSKFGATFDFAVARSIFSHASPGMIGQAFESFRDNSSPGAVMLASYNLQAGDAGDVVDVLNRGEWSWRRYTTSFLQQLAQEHGLSAGFYGKTLNGQVWLKVIKP